jgi:hypothetical protein
LLKEDVFSTGNTVTHPLPDTSCQTDAPSDAGTGAHTVLNGCLQVNFPAYSSTTEATYVFTISGPFFCIPFEVIVWAGEEEAVRIGGMCAVLSGHAQLTLKR